nr:NAD-dependent epimerase/dehydratase family protein [Thermoanaerobacterales bacterium]
MRIVVVGATGNVGTSVVDELARRPEVTEVVAVARRAPAVDWPPSVRFVAADVATDDLEP